MTEEPSPLSTGQPDGSISHPGTKYAQTTMACNGAQRKLLSSPSAKSSMENCNPNVSYSSCKRKIYKSSATDQFYESSSTPKPLSGHVCAEFNLISPPRKHACSSRRCASKNPDYAVPTTANPKKFLVSKRHALLQQGATLCKCSLRESKGGVSAVDDQSGSCNRCSHESQLRRWSADESGFILLTEDRKSSAFSIPSSEPHDKDALHSSDSAQPCAFTEAFMTTAVGLPVAETAHQESAIDRFEFKSWSRSNDLSNFQAQQGDTQDNHLKTANIVGDITSQMKLAPANEPEVQASSCPGRKRRSYDASCPDQSSAIGDDGCSRLMPEEEDSPGVSPSPEKSGNWRLNAVLEAFENLSPTREGRVKTLVRAFESLMSFTEGKVEQQAGKPRGYPLQFSYLTSNANLQGGKKSQKEDFADGGGGGEKEDVRDEEEEGERHQWHEVGTWQGVEDEENYGIGEQWHMDQAEGEYADAVVQYEERDRMGDRWKNQEVEEMFDHSNQKGVANTEEKVFQRQESPRLYAQPDGHESNQHVEQLGERVYAQRFDEDEDGKQAGRNLSTVSFEGDKDEEVGKQHDEQSAERLYAQTAEEDEDRKQPQEQAVGNTGSFEEDEEVGKQHDEQPGERVYAQTDEDGKQPQEQAAGNISAGSFEEGSIYEESEEDDQSQEPEARPVSALPDKPAAFERQPPDQKMCVDLQRHFLQKSMDGYFASTAARKKSSSRNRKHSQVSNCSVSSIRPPLAQKSQTQPEQDKPRPSKPQPFKLLTEERGHMKEQEFFMRLRRIVEEEERLRVPLAQGLPWTTDEPEVPYKPPVKETTKPLDVHLNSDLRAMERAEFDRFIAEKLLYIEERRLEEERLRRIAEEEEIKRMRQEMVPKAQLMPYFDRPFRPIRSSKRPTIPKEPQFQHNKLPKRQKCVASST